MKKVTVGLIGAILVIMVSSNVWAQSGLRIDLGGNGFVFSISDSRYGLSTFGYDNYRPYPHYYSGYYPNRPYLGWGGYRGHHHHNHQYWGHHKPGHHHKDHSYGHQRGYKRDGHGKHYRNHNRRGHHGRHWRR